MMRKIPAHNRSGSAGFSRWCAATVAAIVVFAPGAYAGPPFVTDEPDTVAPGHWEIFLYSDGAARASDASGLGPGLEVNYGPIEGIELHSIVNLAYNDPHGAPAQFGLGDSEFGVKIRLLNPGPADWYPQAAIFPTIEVPTGNANRGLGAGTAEEFLPLWLSKQFGQWSVFSGAGYWITPAAGDRNYWFTGVGMQNQITDKITLGGEVFYQTSENTGRNGVLGYNVGGIYDLSEHEHLMLAIGRGGLVYAINAALMSKPFAYFVAIQWTY